ncbi:MAG: hypothetical protein Q4G14_13925, partial [Paracoccus sp. (in: a-proteobacteria)]|uniref:hypothetical protein n=1 Tax=Paracoccus sp. TaxID=267 RepID=UPI0026E10825
TPPETPQALKLARMGQAPTLLRQAGVINNRKGLLVTSLSASAGSAASSGALSRIMADRPIPCRHRLHALAVARADQTRDMGRTYPPSRLVPERRNKRCRPAFQIVTPGSLNAGSL